MLLWTINKLFIYILLNIPHPNPHPHPTQCVAGDGNDNCNYSKDWDGIIYHFPNCSGAAIKVSDIDNSRADNCKYQANRSLLERSTKIGTHTPYSLGIALLIKPVSHLRIQEGGHFQDGRHWVFWNTAFYNMIAETRPISMILVSNCIFWVCGLRIFNLFHPTLHWYVITYPCRDSHVSKRGPL